MSEIPEVNLNNNVDYDEEEAFLYGSLESEPMKSNISNIENEVKPSTNKIKTEEIEDDDLFDIYGDESNNESNNVNENTRQIETDTTSLFEENLGQIETDTTTNKIDDNEVDQTYLEDIQDIDPLEPSGENGENGENGNLEMHESIQEQLQDQHEQEIKQDLEIKQEQEEYQPLKEGEITDEYEEDDSESDIEIIMDSVPPPKPVDNGTRNSLVNIKPNSFNKPIGPQRHEGGQTSSSRTPGVDINAIGTIDGTSIYDVDLDSFEDKPWRKPGADITDYFNYGFNEYSWKAYCAKQKQMREDQHSRKKIHVYESKQEVNNLPPELQSISQPQTGGDHPRFQQQRGRGRRGRDQDDSVIQVVSSEREAALEELEPIPQPTIIDNHQNDDYGMESSGYPQDFQGPPMGMGMFPPPDMQMGPHPPFFMGNPEMPPSGPMGFDPSYRSSQAMRNMNNMGNIMRPTGMPGGIPGGMPGMTNRMPPSMPGNIPGGMTSGMSGGMPGMSRGMPGGMVGRGRGMTMDERPFFGMDDQSWEMENRNAQSFRPVFQGRPPTGPMHGTGVNRTDYNDWEHSPPPDAPFSHRMRPPFRPGAPPTGPADHRGLSASVESPGSNQGEEERSGDNRSASGSVERSHPGSYDRDNRGYPRSRDDERWDGSRKRTTGEAPRDDDEFRAKRRH